MIAAAMAAPASPWQGNDLDTYADDLAALVESLDLCERGPRRTLHGRRRGGPLHRAPAHAGRQGRADRRYPAADAEDAANPGGLPIEVFTSYAQRRRRPLAVLEDLSMPFYATTDRGEISKACASVWRGRAFLKTAVATIAGTSPAAHDRLGRLPRQSTVRLGGKPGRRRPRRDDPDGLRQPATAEDPRSRGEPRDRRGRRRSPRRSGGAGRPAASSSAPCGCGSRASTGTAPSTSRRASRSPEIERAVKPLRERVAELEAKLASCEATNAEPRTR